MPKRRGTIEKRGENSWRIKIRLGKGADGKPQRHVETVVGTWEQAEARLNELLNQLDTGRFVQTNDRTFGDYLLYWLDTYARPHTEEGSTYREYERYAKKRIIPALGQIPLNKLTALHIDHFYASLQRDGARQDGKPGRLGPATVHRIHAVVHESLKHAVQWHLIPYNPAAEAHLPKVPKAKKRLWTTLQLQRFLAAIKESPYRALILTLAYSGMRIGEVLGLKWDDIDFEARIIRVDEALKRHTRKLGSTKTDKEREVPLADELAEVLRHHRAEQAKIKLAWPGWNPDGLVFPTSIGTPEHYHNFYRRIWRPLIEAAGVPYINIHGTRHTFATLMIASGEDPRVVQEILGHGDVAFTLREYDHPDKEEHRRAIDAFSRRVRGGR